MDDGDGPDPTGQFHRNEAISAVADDGFLAEEDDDYEDLYNDVNVGEGFYQSMRKNEEDLGFKNEAVEETKKKVELPEVSAPQHHGAPIPSSGGEGSGFGNNQNQGFRGNEMKGPIGGGGGMRIELGQGGSKLNEFEQHSRTNIGVGAQPPPQQHQLQPQQPPQPPHQHQQLQGGGAVGNMGNEGYLRQAGGVGGGNMNGVGGNAGPGGAYGGGGAGGAGGATLYVGDLHWWTTDAELEVELCKYGPVKEVKFFDEKASGKSKGYCQVDFYDSAAAVACKDGMHGHLFNGRPCVVALTSPYSVKRMGEAQVNRNQQVGGQTAQAQPRRGPNDVAGNKPAGNAITTGGNYQGGDNNNRGYGRANWGRGNTQGMGGRGPGGPMRNRGGMSGRGIMGNSGNGFGPGIGATPPMMHPQSMMGQGFDPAFGGPMGRMGNYGGFPGAPQPPFSGMMSSFPPVGGVGLPGVAPHVNPAFFGRGMPMNGMGMMPTSGVDGPNMGMWPDPNMGGGWPGEEHGGGRAGESSYGEEAGSDHQYGEGSDRGGWPNAMKEKDRGSERDWSGSSDRRHREDRDRDQGFDRDMPREKDVGHDHEWSERRHRSDVDVNRERDRERDRGRERSRDRDRDRYREDRERYADHHKYRDHQDDMERGRSTRTHSKARISEDDDHRSRSRDRRSRSRDVDYGKRRRLTSE